MLYLKDIAVPNYFVFYFSIYVYYYNARKKNKHRKENPIWKPLRESKRCWTPTMKLSSTDLSFLLKQKGAWLWKPWRESKSCSPSTTKPFGTDLSEETGFLKGVLLWRPWRELKLCCPSTTKPSSIDFRLRGYRWQMMKLNPRLLKRSKRRGYFFRARAFGYTCCSWSVSET